MVSLIISFYKDIIALDLIFKTLSIQTCKDFEVIVAEDDNAVLSKEFIDNAKSIYFFPIKHVSHEKLGFRKTKILNDAIKISSSEKLVFIDGDCLLHKRFIESYTQFINENGYYYGRRVMLSPSITKKISITGDISLLNSLSFILHRVPNPVSWLYLPLVPQVAKSSREIWGCNWGVLKKYVIGVNGFDEDYNAACYGEDLDIAWRLKKKYELKLYSLRTRVIQYHLDHRKSYEQHALRELYIEKVNAAIAFCKNGIEK